MRKQHPRDLRPMGQLQLNRAVGDLWAPACSKPGLRPMQIGVSGPQARAKKRQSFYFFWHVMYQTLGLSETRSDFLANSAHRAGRTRMV